MDNSLLNKYFSYICEKLPAIDKIVSQYGSNTIEEYIKTINHHETDSFQSRDDLLDVIWEYSSRLLGDDVADRLKKDFRKYPIAITANHHGVNFHAQTFQANLIFSLERLTGGVKASTIPVFSFGNISQNNPTYPRGMLIYSSHIDELNDIPIKVPVMPDRFKRQMVSVSLPFDKLMLNRVEERVNKIFRMFKISERIYTTLSSEIIKDYNKVLNRPLSSYSDQCVILNNFLWKRLLKDHDIHVDMVYLEIEDIASELLKSDVLDTESLARNIFFESVLREELLSELNGEDLCWNLESLTSRLEEISDRPKGRNQSSPGTVFFWGVDDKKRRVPLMIDRKIDDKVYLLGVDDAGNEWRYPFSPEKVIDGLNNGRLVPSAFTCFLTISFARGVSCIGGYFQTDYLPKMLQGIVRALKRIKGYNEVSEKLTAVNTEYYIDGMLLAMCNIGNKALVPAGLLEFIASGGINLAMIEKISQLSVRTAIFADIVETLPDALPVRTIDADWKLKVAEESFTFLSQEVLTIPPFDD